MTPKEMLTNPYFCPMPWTGLMYNFDGQIKNCIRSAGPLGDIKTQPISDIMLFNNHVRQQQIVDQQPVPTCHTCYDIERGKKGLDHISDRIFYIRELKSVDPNTFQPGRFDLHAVDMRWSNLCNFACIYCGPRFSSRWSDELKVQHQVPDQQQTNEIKNFVYDHANQLQHVYLAGGEPLLIKENLSLLDKLSPTVNLRINTNLSKVDTRVFEAVCAFENVHWTVSIDSVGKEFEYVRYGSSWQDFLDNLAIIRSLPHKITFNMLHFLLNYDSIFGCVEYLQNWGFHANSFVIGPLLDPDWLDVRHLPDHVLGMVKNKLQEKINQKPGYLLEDSYQNMLHYIETPMEKNIRHCVGKIHELDQRRGLDSRSIFTNFYKDINHGKAL